MTLTVAMTEDRKITGSVNLVLSSSTGPATPGGPRSHASPIFCVAKRKKGDKGKKERFSKQKLLKAVTKVKILLF